MQGLHQSAEDLFLNSALCAEGKYCSINEVMSWLDQRKEEVVVNVDQIKFAELKGWHFDNDSGNLIHASGKFFSIEGINVHTNWGVVQNWQQPIINQPEVGILGIICKEIDGILHFLLQCKIEPGNINFVQLSPTVQATRSNYTQVHKGERPQFVDYFLDTSNANARVLLDQLQSEQGARFFKKRNRNMIIQIFDDVDFSEDFKWLSLGQIKQLLRRDNVVNMDTRTVISCIRYGKRNQAETTEIIQKSVSDDRFHNAMLRSAVESTAGMHDIHDIIAWTAGRKCEYELLVDRIDLKDVKHWKKDEHSIYHEDKKYFSVIAVNVRIDNREVSTWTQPLVKSAQEGIIAFLIKKIDGVYHFLVHSKLEAGNFDIIELAPTVQCLNDNYRESIPEQKPEYLDFVLNAPKKSILYDTMQSEEGGRFFREQNRNMIIDAGNDFPEEVPKDYIWMTLGQISTFIQFNNYFNIQSRSLISAISFV